MNHSVLKIGRHVRLRGLGAFLGQDLAQREEVPQALLVVLVLRVKNGVQPAKIGVLNHARFHGGIRDQTVKFLCVDGIHTHIKIPTIK